MSAHKPSFTPVTLKMDFTWKILFLFAGGLGIAAMGAAVIELAGIDLGELYTEEMSTSGAWVSLGVGFAFGLFAFSGLRNAHMTLDSKKLSYLRLGPLCTTAAIELDNIKRFGSGTEKHGHQVDQILVLELIDGTKRSIKISMFEEWEKLIDALETALGQEEVEGKQGWTGVHLEDAEN